jgi:hypothetical protein
LYELTSTLMSSIKAMKVAAGSILILIGSFAFGAAKAETSINWLPGTAPAELLACTSASLANDTSEEGQRILDQITDRLVQAAIKSKIASIGEPFVFRITPGQVADIYPMSLDFCMPIDKRPDSSEIEFQYVEVAARPVRLGFCAAPSSADCQAAVDSAIVSVSEPAKPDEGGVKDATKGPTGNDADLKTAASAPKLNEIGVRSGAWQSTDPPADPAGMQIAVYRMWPPSEAPFAGGSVSGGDDSQPAPRELGKVPGTPTPSAPRARIDAPSTSPVAGFVFSIPPR